MTFNLTPNLELELRRCHDCGTFWAIERCRVLNLLVCPRCGGEEVRKANERAGAAERSKVSLKGALTRQKR